MGNYVSANAKETIRRKMPLMEIFVKVSYFDYEFVYKYGDIIEPYSGKLDAYNSEIDGIIKSLDRLSNLYIDFDEIFIYTSHASINYISNALYRRTDNAIILHFSDKNIKLVETR